MSEIEIDKAEEVKQLKSDVFSAAASVRESEKAGLQDMQADAEKQAEADAKEENKSTKVVWQFKFRRYVCITNIIDKAAGALKDGRRPKLAIRARNWRYPLDLSIETDKKIREYLLKSSQCGTEFMLLKEAKKDKTDLKDRALTLTKLWDMDYEQLIGMLDAAEKEEAGIVPGAKPTREELILAIIDAKKLSGGM